MKTLGSHMASIVGLRPGSRRSLAPFARYVAVLVAFVLFYGWLFHVIMAAEGQEHSWFTGIYWALTVMSTLGFGDITFHSDVGRFFSIVVLITGVVLLLIILPFLFIQFVYVPFMEQRQRSRARSLEAVPDHVHGHVLICANDPIALGLVRRLELSDVPAFVIFNNGIEILFAVYPDQLVALLVVKHQLVIAAAALGRVGLDAGNGLFVR